MLLSRISLGVKVERVISRSLELLCFICICEGGRGRGRVST